MNLPDFLHLVLGPPPGSLLYSGQYDPLLVALSITVAIFAAYASLIVTRHVSVTTSRISKSALTLAGGLCMGAGIWAMHFTGMLAFSLPCTVSYDPGITILSMIPGILASTLAVGIISRPRVSRHQLLLGGLLFGAGISAMHYCGMSAYRLNGFIRYDIRLVFLSFLLAVMLATAALWMKFRLHSWKALGKDWASAIAAIVMGMAVITMHYTAMASAYFIRDDRVPAPGSRLTQAVLAAVVLVATIGIIILTLVATFPAQSAGSSLRKMRRIVAFLVICWTVVAWMSSSYYSDHLLEREYREGRDMAGEQIDSVAMSIETDLNVIKGLPEMLVNEDAIRSQMIRSGSSAAPSPLPYETRRRLWTADPGLARINRFLNTTADKLGVNTVWLLNAAGECVAASNAHLPKSNVGFDYSSTDYFRANRTGRPGHAYALGLLTGVPGLYYSQPIIDNGHFFGAIVAKRHVRDLARWTGPSNAIVADSYGVIILTGDPRLENNTMPGSTVLGLSSDERIRIYKRSVFPVLKMEPWKGWLPLNALYLGEQSVPVVLAEKALPGHGITIYVPRPVPELILVNQERPWLFFLIAMSGSMVIIAVSAITLYLHASRRAKMAAEEHREELKRIAHYDSLTGVPNRRLLTDRLNLAIARARRRNSLLAVCYIDLDGFKPVNDRLGHDAGDELLIRITQKIKATLRAEDTLARLGGDEFVLLFNDITVPDECFLIIERVLSAINSPQRLNDSPVSVSASIGVTIYPQDPVDADTLLRHADQAMYHAKEAGKNRYHLFDPDQDQQTKARFELLESIRNALAGHELTLYYQPKVNLVSSEVIGVEALIRWRHPQRGVLPPSEFLPVLRGTDLDIAIGEWVIEKALAQIAIWREGGVNLPVSVNISAHHLQMPQFATRLQSKLEEFSTLNADNLELEIVESAAIADLEHASQTMQSCISTGVRFALDDFGTGYSSLAYFRKLPVDTLKIDQTFVRDMIFDPEDLGIVESVIDLAGAFHRPVIAEGVESIEQGAMLIHLGCHFGQGYAIARPMPPENIPPWIVGWRGEDVWRTIATTPLPRENLMLVVAKESHLKWVAEVAHFIEDGSGQLPILSSHDCSFGRWFSGSGFAKYGQAPEYHAIRSLHDGIHTLAEEIMNNVQSGQADSARSRLPDFHAAKDRFILALEALAEAQG